MLSGPDILVILVVALVLFGPKKLPELGKALGETLAEFKSATEKATSRHYFEPADNSRQDVALKGQEKADKGE